MKIIAAIAALGLLLGSVSAHAAASLQLRGTSDNTGELNVSDPLWGERFLSFDKDASKIGYHPDPADLLGCGAMELAWTVPVSLTDQSESTVTLTATMPIVPQKPRCGINLEVATAPIFNLKATNDKGDVVPAPNGRTGIFIGRLASGTATAQTVTQTVKMIPTMITQMKDRTADDFAIYIIIGTANIVYHYKIENY